MLHAASSPRPSAHCLQLDGDLLTKHHHLGPKYVFSYSRSSFQDDPYTSLFTMPNRLS